MTYEEYYQEKWGDAKTETADRTFGEQVFSDAQRLVWEDVFQTVSDKPHLASRELIKDLETKRGEAGFGPQ